LRPISPAADLDGAAELTRLRRRLQDAEDRLSSLEQALVCCLRTVVDFIDVSAGLQSSSLAELAVRVGRKLGLAEDLVRDIEIAAMLRDVGKIAVPTALLRKGEPLLAEETRTLRRHAELGWALLHTVPGFERVALLVLHHHERIDGAGYPSGLRGREIPVGARLIAVLDAFDAMTRDRPHRRAMSVDQALAELSAHRGSQFDHEIVDRFLEVVREDPDLANGRRDEVRDMAALTAAARAGVRGDSA
jgi:HD-GYP domain-containing protein (c-di-GMP phosphodiesterase class II)